MKIDLSILWSRKSLAIGLAFLSYWPHFALSMSEAFFFNNNLDTPTSYISFDRGLIRIYKDYSQFELAIDKKGVIHNVLVEKRVRNHRITIQANLENGRYVFKRAFITNQKLYFLTPDNGSIKTGDCGLKSSSLNALSKVVNKAASKTATASVLENSCDKVAGSKKLNGAFQYINEESSQCKNLNSCLLNLKQEANSEVLSKNIDSVIQTIAGISQHQKKTNTKVPAVACSTRPPGVSKDKLAAYDLSSNKIQFFPDPDFTEIEAAQIDKALVHEIVHASIRPGTQSSTDEALANSITKKCVSGEALKPSELKDLINKSTEHVLIVDSQSKKAVSQLSKADDIKIREAVQATPVQQISTSDIGSVAKVAQDTTPANSRMITNSFSSVMAKPINAFSQMADRVASVVVPTASASTGTASSSSNNTSFSRSRSIASVPNPGMPQTDEKLTEEIIIPDPSNPSALQKTTLVHNDSSSSQLLHDGIKESSETAKAKATSIKLSQGSQKNNSLIGSNISATANLAGSNTNDKNSAAQKQSSNNPLTSIQGVSFVAGTIAGTSYQTYKEKIKNPDFKKALEANGILITENGSLISKPEKVSLAYIDNGKSLIYADF